MAIGEIVVKATGRSTLSHLYMSLSFSHQCSHSCQRLIVLSLSLLVASAEEHTNSTPTSAERSTSVHSYHIRTYTRLPLGVWLAWNPGGGASKK